MFVGDGGGGGVKSMFHPYLSFLLKYRNRIENNQKKKYFRDFHLFLTA